MKFLKNKYIPISILVYGMLLFGFYVMFNSWQSGITWKVIFSTVGFIGFLGIAVLYTKGLYDRYFSKDPSS